MKKNEHIRKVIGTTKITYNNTIDQYFNLWCAKYAQQRALPLRKLVTNESLYKWYLGQWLQKVELPFYIDNRDYMEAGIFEPGKFQDLYLSYAETVENYYPQPILNRIANAHKKHQLQAHG